MQTISRNILEDTMYYKNIPVLVYRIQYPSFTSTCSFSSAQSINNYYASAAKEQEAYCRTVLYSQAVDYARYLPDNQPPFNSYQFFSDYHVTFNSCCITSLYLEQYTYLGGAHGTTLRISHTWNFFTGGQLQLKDFYPDSFSIPEDLLDSVTQQTAERLALSPSSYFDDYGELIRKNFRPENFYLRPAGAVVYYQQYDIAPYAAGIPEFLIPFAGTEQKMG